MVNFSPLVERVISQNARKSQPKEFSGAHIEEQFRPISPSKPEMLCRSRRKPVLTRTVIQGEYRWLHCRFQKSAAPAAWSFLPAKYRPCPMAQFHQALPRRPL